MTVAETHTPFGTIGFHVRGARLEGRFEWAPVTLSGVTARQATAYVNAGPGTEIEVELTSTINPVFQMGLLVQDGIEAHEVIGDEILAAFGLRNGLWIDAQPGLSLIAFEGGPGRAHYAITSHEQTATAFTAVVAWTENPTTDAEDAAPRNAVAEWLSA
ncbi:MAG: hypothetical protein ACPGFA_05700 [Pikeienuella sp.]